MVRYLVFIALIVVAIVSTVLLILQSTGVSVITLNEMSVEMKTSTLLFIIVIGFMLLYGLIGLLRYLFSIRSRFRAMNKKRLSTKAGKELIQGLLLVAEGHWNKAEKLLLKNAKHSETPVINYLAAARAAHLQDDSEHRDDLLRQATELDEAADIVVSISQAEMQMDSKQVEQAQATLLRLQALAPSHPYITKLLAKVYYKQKNWSSLFDLMPALTKQKILKGEEADKLKTAAIQGLFEAYAKESKADDIQKSWKKLPSNIRKSPDAVLLYAKSVSQAGEEQIASDVLVASINETWDDRLVELYGQLTHKDPIKSGDKASQWLNEHRDNPTLLLTLARLNMQKKLWGKAKSFYESSLNMKPNTAAYLELAQLLEQIGEQDNANNCNRIGLQFCISGKAERLNLKSDTAEHIEISQPVSDEDEFYTV